MSEERISSKEEVIAGKNKQGIPVTEVKSPTYDKSNWYTLGIGGAQQIGVTGIGSINVDVTGIEATKPAEELLSTEAVTKTDESTIENFIKTRKWPQPTEGLIMGLPRLVMSGADDLQKLYERSFPIIIFKPFTLRKSEDYKGYIRDMDSESMPTYKFAIMNEGGIDIQITNNFGPSMLEQELQKSTKKLQLLRDIKQVSQNNNMIGGITGQAINRTMGTLEGVNNKFFGDVAKQIEDYNKDRGINKGDFVGNAQTLGGEIAQAGIGALSTVIHGLLGNRIDIPNIWTDSSGTNNITVKIDLRCRSCGSLETHSSVNNATTSNTPNVLGISNPLSSVLGLDHKQKNSNVGDMLLNGATKIAAGAVSSQLSNILGNNNILTRDVSNALGDGIGAGSAGEEYYEMIVKPLACLFALSLPYRKTGENSEGNKSFDSSTMIYDNPPYLEVRIGSTYESKCCCISNMRVNILHKEYSYYDDRPYHVVVTLDIVDLYNTIVWDDRTLDNNKPLDATDDTPNSARIIKNLLGPAANVQHDSDRIDDIFPLTSIAGLNSSSSEGGFLSNAVGGLLGNLGKGLEKVLDGIGLSKTPLGSITSTLFNGVVGRSIKNTLSQATNVINSGLSSALTSAINGNGFDLSNMKDSLLNTVKNNLTNVKNQAITTGANMIVNQAFGLITGKSDLLDTKTPALAIETPFINIGFKGNIADMSNINFRLKPESIFKVGAENDESSVRYIFDEPTRDITESIVQEQIDNYLKRTGKTEEEVTSTELKVDRIDNIYAIEYHAV